jgi:hypothetical protein
MTVGTELDVANPNNLPDLVQLAELGKGAALIARTERVTTIAANIATLTFPAQTVLRCIATAAGTPGYKLPVVNDSTPGAGQCAVNMLGNIEFAAADAVTSCLVTYVPVEGELITETITVTAGGVGTFLNSKECNQIVSATLVAPAVTPGAKVVVDYGTLVGALAAGQCAVQFAGTTIQFVAAEAGVACTATVVYYASPGVGTGSGTPFGERLEAAYDPYA